MKILSVVGARPQFVKLGAICRVLTEVNCESHVIVHTGQHYDPALSDVFFRDFGIPTPDVHLGVGSETHGVQTGRMLAGLDSVLADCDPDWTLVYGDTNSTIAAALAAVKLHLPVAHLEAGLRSFNRRMPEEHNRVLTDHAADLLLAPTAEAVRNLANENLADRAVLVGDVMADVCLHTRQQVKNRPNQLPVELDPAGPYLVATIHRAENTDDGDRLHAIIRTLRDMDTPVVLFAHPRLVSHAQAFGIELGGGSLHSGPPVAYPTMVRTLMSASGVITDSGGLQKEAFILGVPCTTIRSETEWTETLEDGWNLLDPDLRLVRTHASRRRPTGPQPTPYGDGDAASRVLQALVGENSA